MKTTMRLDESLHAEAKELAAQTGQSLSDGVKDALREMLARRGLQVERPPVRLPTFAGKGLQPGIDLDDSAALLDLMDRFEGPPQR